MQYIKRRVELESQGISELEAHKTALLEYLQQSEKPIPEDLESCDSALVLNWFYTTLKAEGKLDQVDDIKDNFFKYVKVK